MLNAILHRGAIKTWSFVIALSERC